MVSIVLTVALFTVKLWTHREPAFVTVTVGAANDQDAQAQIAEIERAHQARLNAVQDRIHAEMVSLTLFGLALLLVPLKASGIPEWTKYVIGATAATSITACFLTW